MHAHTFSELKKKYKTKEVAKLWDFSKVLRNVFLGTQGSLLFLFWFLCWIFDHFIGVFDYLVGRSMLSSNQGQWQHFFDTKLFLARSYLEPNFSTGPIIGETGNDLQADLKADLICPPRFEGNMTFEEKIKEWHTDPQKTSAGPWMTAIVGDEELQKRKASWIPQNTPTNTWAVHIWFERVKEKESNNLNQINSETIPLDSPEIFYITDKGELNYWLTKFVIKVHKKKDPRRTNLNKNFYQK